MEESWRFVGSKVAIGLYRDIMILIGIGQHSDSMSVWRNGRRDRLKPDFLRSEGSTPSMDTGPG